MGTQVLPKSRSGQQAVGVSRGGGSRRVSSIQDLSHKGRAISGRVISKGKRISSNNRYVSRGDLFVGREDDANNSFEDNAIHFDENKNTILSNFEEWIKLSTDNKITTKNSWQFALIDYFHDLNVIKDGENINFQRASATLDGCVKIYLSRVESVATETGKLLSGLATKKAMEKDKDGEDDDGDEEGEIDDSDESLTENNDAKKKRKINRVLESTLVPFDTIRVKKLDQELAIDPLFKKALAEFDEGGAKSLLLNTLSIDYAGRVVFDATSSPLQEEMDPASVVNKHDDTEVEVNGLRSFLYNAPSEMNDLAVCPSIDQLEVVLNDITKAKAVLGDVNNKLNTETEAASDGMKMDDDMDAGPLAYDFDDYDGQEINDMDNDNMVGQDGTETPRNIENISLLIFNNEVQSPTKTGNSNILDRDLMAYFDERMKTNWRGPEHWRIAAIKKTKRFDEAPVKKESSGNENGPGLKKKQQTIINFFDEHDINEDILFETPKNALSTTRKPDQRTDSNANKLPEDIQYNSAKLTNLFMKPQTSILYFSKDRATNKCSKVRPLTDEMFFADQYQRKEEDEKLQERMSTSMRQADLDELNDLGGDADFGGIDFNDALEEPGSSSGTENFGMAGNTQLITGGRKVRPEYVNFSRIAKRVDIRLLKDKLWNGLKSYKGQETEAAPKLSEALQSSETLEYPETPQPSENSQPLDVPQPSETVPTTFGKIVEKVSLLYGSEEKKDLSTSFCFICLLHLANEHSLSISNTDSYDDLVISGL